MLNHSMRIAPVKTASHGHVSLLLDNLRVVATPRERVESLGIVFAVNSRGYERSCPAVLACSRTNPRSWRRRKMFQSRSQTRQSPAQVSNPRAEDPKRMAES